MYLIEESIENDQPIYIVKEKIQGHLIEEHKVSLNPRSCSCRYFAESHNCHNHFHIVLVENWIKNNKPCCAMYAKSKTGKIVTLCPGFVKVSQNK